MASMMNSLGNSHNDDQPYIGKKEIQKMIEDSLNQAQENFQLEVKNHDADKLVFETKLR